jgi:hypothetical protein
MRNAPLLSGSFTHTLPQREPVTSMLRHWSQVKLRTSGRTSSTPPTYSGPSPSQHSPTPNINADHTAHWNSGPSLRPASLHEHDPDQDHVPRYNSDVLQDVRTTTPYGTAPTYSGPSPDFYVHYGIHVGLLDSLTGCSMIPGVLRTTPELIRTTEWILTHVGLLDGLLALGPILVHVLHLSKILRTLSRSLRVLWPSRQTSGRPVRPPVHP